VSLAAGAGHACAVTNAGAAWCWGFNDNGQLGNGTTTLAATPVAVSGLASHVIAITAGYDNHTCALTDSGAVWCWGDNYNGQLGNGVSGYGAHSTTPVAVTGLPSGIVAISAGTYHTCALTDVGAVWCWGENFSGELGNGTTINSSTPVAVSGLSSGVVAIAASDHTCAVTDVGEVWCWGYNGYGQLGNNGNVSTATPVRVLGVGGFSFLNLGATPPACSDFNGDGKSDLIWRQASTGATVLWQMNGSAVSSSAYLGGSSDWSVTATGDFDGDGKSDLIWRQASTGATFVWLMNGSTTSSSGYLGGSPDWSVTATGDFNGDGKSDLVWRQSSTGASVQWLMNGSTALSSGYLGGSTDWAALVLH
jgi:hypothetical protein